MRGGRGIRRAGGLLAVTMAAGFAAPATVGAAELHVTTSADTPAGPGSFPGRLRQEVQGANAGDVVVIDAGVQPSLVRGEVLVTASITIRGQGINSTSINANELSRIFTVTGGTTALTLEDLTLENGKPPGVAAGQSGGNGGAINNLGGKLTLNRVRVRDSAAGDGGINNGAIAGGAGGGGGGIFSLTGDVAVTDSVFARNAAGSGGMGLGEEGPRGRGGAIEVGGDSDLDVTGSTLLANDGGDRGGAIHSSGDTLDLSNSTLHDNSAHTGSGVFEDSSGNARIKHVTFDRNISGGGAIAKSGGPTHFVSIENSLFNFNGLALPGDGMVTNNCGSATITPLLDLGGNVAYPAEHILESTPCPTGFATVDPGIGGVATGRQPADNGGPTPTVSLLAGSPAVDRIPAADCVLPVDQRGVSRPSGAGCDPGAYELQQPPPVSPVAQEPTPGPTKKKKCKRKKKGKRAGGAAKCRKKKRR